MKIREKIKAHSKEQKFSRITRQVAKDRDEISRGYIVDYSKDFIVLQETEDFRALGFNILPIEGFKKIRYNKYDKYYDKIMNWENEKSNIGLKTEINLSDWYSIFKSFQEKKMNIIVECENPEIDLFTIGAVKEVNGKSVSVLNFDATGFVDKKSTKIEYRDITKVIFDDRYIDVFSKYTRKRKKGE